MFKVAAVLPLAFVAIVASANYVVVDVTTDGNHFVIPVPLVVARAAVALAPEEITRIPCPGVRRVSGSRGKGSRGAHHRTRWRLR